MKKKDYKDSYLSIYNQIEKLYEKQRLLRTIFLMMNELQNKMEDTNNYVKVAAYGEYITFFVYSAKELSLARKLIKDTFEEWADKISSVDKEDDKIIVRYENLIKNEILNKIRIRHTYYNISEVPKSIIGDNCKFKKVKYEREELVCKK